LNNTKNKPGVQEGISVPGLYFDHIWSMFFGLVGFVVFNGIGCKK